MIVASDVEALYPSLDIRAVKKTIFKHTFKTPVQFEEVNYRDTAEYVAMCAKPWEIRLWKIQDIVPTLKNKAGRKPSVRGKNNMTSSAQDKDSPWSHPNRCPTE